MRWPWSAKDEPQGEDETVDRFDEEQGEEETGQEEEGQDQEPELDDAQTAYVERRVQEREAQVRAQVREQLQAQGLDLTGDGAAIRDLNTFAGKFGFVGGGQHQQQQQEQQRPAAEAADPYEALGERPDATYDEEGARDWDRRYRAAIRAETIAEVAPRVQQLEQMFAQTQVSSATERVKDIYRSHGLDALVENPEFEAAFGDALLRQPMETWSDPKILAGIAGYVIPGLKPAAQPERSRDSEGRFLANANRGSLSQVTPPREAGRAPAGEGGQMDATTRALAARMDMTPEEWLHYKGLSAERTESEHREWERRRARSGRR